MVTDNAKLVGMFESVTHTFVAVYHWNKKAT